MIGLKSKSKNEIELSQDINLLHTLTLMPEAVLNSSSLLHCMVSVPFVTHRMALMFAYCKAEWPFSNIIEVAVWCRSVLSLLYPVDKYYHYLSLLGVSNEHWSLMVKFYFSSIYSSIH